MISGEARYRKTALDQAKGYTGGSTTNTMKNDFPHVQKIPNARKDRLLGNTQNQNNILDSGTGAKIDSNANQEPIRLDFDDEKQRALLLPKFAP